MTDLLCVVPGCTEPATRGIYGPALCERHGAERGTPLAPQCEREKNHAEPTKDADEQ